MLKISLLEGIEVDILDVAPVNIAIHGSNNDIVWANQAYQRATGRTLAEITGKPCYVAWGLSVLCNNCPVVRALSTGEPQEGELSPQNQDNWPETQGVWYCKAIPLKDANGAVIGALETAHDITILKQNEKILQERNHYNRSLIEVSLDPLVTIDRAERISDANPAAEAITGYTRRELIGTDFSHYFTDPEKARKGYLQALNDGAVRDYELEIQRRDGHTTPVLYNSSVYFDQTGQIQGVFAAARDISLLKSNEQSLRDNEELFRTVADFTYDWESWRLADGTYRYVSPSCARICGHSPEEFLKNPGLIFEITHPDDLREVRNHYLREEFVQEKEDLGIVYRIFAADGSIRWISHRCTPVYNSNGIGLGRRESNRDVTQQKIAQEEKDRIESHNRKLAKAASLGRMAGAIAHHFNNKLHAVLGNLEFIMNDLGHDNVCFNGLTSAMEAAKEAAKVSRMMLTYLGQVSSKQSPLDFASICRDILPSLQNSLPKNTKVSTHFPEPGPVVKANAQQIRQIVTNLFTNSLESSEVDHFNTIDLTISDVKSSEISGENRYPVDWQAAADRYAYLEVRDTGGGISPEILQELFTPFYSTKFTGRGLGLPVVLGLVQTHAGVITVESQQGKGTIFRVHLPLIEARRIPKEQIITHSAGGSTSIATVLLADDDDIVIRVTSLMLTRMHLRVLTARDGIEALELFRQNEKDIDLVITDVSMPRMDGWETLSALRQIRPDIPVILASGYTEEQVMEGCHSEQPQAFLGKPFSFEELHAAVVRTLAESAADLHESSE